MRMEDIKNICVVGAGNMGHQISLLAAVSGFETICTDVIPESLEKAEKFALNYIAGRVEKGKMSEGEGTAVRNRLSFSRDLKTAANRADFVIEAISENMALKRNLFTELDKIAPSHAILATNSSMIGSSALADVTARPSKVVNMHFFNPALVMKLVEVVKGPHVSDETAELTMKLSEKFSKIPILILKEVDGFVLNRILHRIFREALWLHEMGIASAEDIDKACVFGAGHPMGPFRLMDLTGIDLNYEIFMAQFAKSGDAAMYPAPSLVKLHAQGHLGDKTGQGFFTYKK